MSDYDEEQSEIIEKSRTMNGPECEEMIKCYIEKHLDRTKFTIWRQVKIKDVLTNKNRLKKHDLIITRSDTKPVDGKETYSLNEVFHVIEVKKSRLQRKGIERFKELKKSISNMRPVNMIKFSLIRLFANYDRWRNSFEKGEYFLLSKPGKWKEFVENLPK